MWFYLEVLELCELRRHGNRESSLEWGWWFEIQWIKFVELTWWNSFGNRIPSCGINKRIECNVEELDWVQVTNNKLPPPSAQNALPPNRDRDVRLTYKQEASDASHSTVTDLFRSVKQKSNQKQPLCFSRLSSPSPCELCPFADHICLPLS